MTDNPSSQHKFHYNDKSCHPKCLSHDILHLPHKSLIIDNPSCHPKCLRHDILKMRHKSLMTDNPPCHHRFHNNDRSCHPKCLSHNILHLPHRFRISYRSSHHRFHNNDRSCHPKYQLSDNYMNYHRKSRSRTIRSGWTHRKSQRSIDSFRPRFLRSHSSHHQANRYHRPAMNKTWDC